MEWDSQNIPNIDVNTISTENFLIVNNPEVRVPDRRKQPLSPVSSPRAPLSSPRGEDEDLFRKYLLNEAEGRKEREEQLELLRTVMLRGLNYTTNPETLKINVISGSMKNLTNYVISSSSQGYFYHDFISILTV